MILGKVIPQDKTDHIIDHLTELQDKLDGDHISIQNRNINWILAMLTNYPGNVMLIFSFIFLSGLLQKIIEFVIDRVSFETPGSASIMIVFSLGLTLFTFVFPLVFIFLLNSSISFEISSNKESNYAILQDAFQKLPEILGLDAKSLDYDMDVYAGTLSGKHLSLRISSDGFNVNMEIRSRIITLMKLKPELNGLFDQLFTKQIVSSTKDVEIEPVSETKVLENNNTNFITPISWHEKSLFGLFTTRSFRIGDLSNRYNYLWFLIFIPVIAIWIYAISMINETFNAIYAIITVVVLLAVIIFALRYPHGFGLKSIAIYHPYVSDPHYENIYLQKKLREVLPFIPSSFTDQQVYKTGDVVIHWPDFVYPKDKSSSYYSPKQLGFFIVNIYVPRNKNMYYKGKIREALELVSRIPSKPEILNQAHLFTTITPAQVIKYETELVGKTQNLKAMALRYAKRVASNWKVLVIIYLSLFLVVPFVMFFTPIDDSIPSEAELYSDTRVENVFQTFTYTIDSSDRYLLLVTFENTTDLVQYNISLRVGENLLFEKQVNYTSSYYLTQQQDFYAEKGTIMKLDLHTPMVARIQLFGNIEYPIDIFLLTPLGGYLVFVIFSTMLLSDMGYRYKKYFDVPELVEVVSTPTGEYNKFTTASVILVLFYTGISLIFEFSGLPILDQVSIYALEGYGIVVLLILHAINIAVPVLLTYFYNYTNQQRYLLTFLAVILSSIAYLIIFDGFLNYLMDSTFHLV